MRGFLDNEPDEELDLESVMLDMLNCGFLDNEPDLGPWLIWSLGSGAFLELSIHEEKCQLG
jgi:hypothetical protein